MIRQFLDVFWFLLRDLWYLWLIVLLIGVAKPFFSFLSEWLEKRRTQKWLEEHKTLEDWKKLGGTEFEKVVAAIYKNLGYKTEKRRIDRGIDIVATKDGKRIFFQCKQMEKVIPDAVRAFWGSIEVEIRRGKGEKGLFVTTGNFTAGSHDFVKDKPIELIDGLKLEKLAKRG